MVIARRELRKYEDDHGEAAPLSSGDIGVAR
jgi:hypothetical protein